MGRKKNRASNDDDYFASLGAPEPEPEPEPAPAANANAGADADADAEIIEDFEVFEEDADDEPAMDPKEEQAALLAENPEESFLGRQLFALRLQQDNDNLSLVQLALVWFMWWLLTRVASYSLVDGVERRFLLGAKDRAQAKEEAEAAAAAAEAEAEEARRRNELWSEAQQKWMPRKLVTEAEPSVEWSEDKGAFVRYRKDPQDPSKEGAWMRCRPEEGWGTAPGKISFRNTDLRPGDVRFYACYGYPEEGADVSKNMKLRLRLRLRLELRFGRRLRLGRSPPQILTPRVAGAAAAAR